MNYTTTVVNSLKITKLMDSKEYFLVLKELNNISLLDVSINDGGITVNKIQLADEVKELLSLESLHIDAYKGDNGYYIMISGLKEKISQFKLLKLNSSFNFEYAYDIATRNEIYFRIIDANDKSLRVYIILLEEKNFLIQVIKYQKEPSSYSFVIQSNYIKAVTNNLLDATFFNGRIFRWFSLWRWLY